MLWPWLERHRECTALLLLLLKELHLQPNQVQSPSAQHHQYTYIN